MPAHHAQAPGDMKVNILHIKALPALFFSKIITMHQVYYQATFYQLKDGTLVDMSRYLVLIAKADIEKIPIPVFVAKWRYKM